MYDKLVSTHHLKETILGFCFFFGIWLSPSVKGDGLNAWQAERVPRLRIASSPYPSDLLHIIPIEQGLGNHLYRVKIDTLGMGPSQETPRGHLYTRRMGFLDLAHIRRTIDFTGYLHYKVGESLRSGRTEFSFESIDRTTYRCRLSFPQWWETIDQEKRERLIDELAIRAGMEGAFDFSNWREILTWYGYHNLPGVPEQKSAFAYEDVPSHFVGVTVAERALRRSGVPFDQAVTQELDQEIEELGRVSAETYVQAMNQVENHWWGQKDCLKRNVDIGLDGKVVEPWLVRNLETGKAPRPKHYRAPSRDYRNLLGYDCRGMITFECEPHLAKRSIMDAILKPGETRVIPARDYPALLKKIEAEVLEVYGPNATRPYP